MPNYIYNILLNSSISKYELLISIAMGYCVSQQSSDSHYLVQYFTQFWFRIHSLPESKRYADTTEEYELLLNRHNEIITDCFG